MPVPRFFGSELPPGTVGARQVPQIPVTKAAQPPIPIKRWVRNGAHPNAWLVNALNEAVNAAAMHRTKQCMWAPGMINGAMGFPASVAGTRERSRWAFHTGPMTHQLIVVAAVYPADGPPYSVRDPYSKCEIRTTAGVLTGSAEFHPGPSSGNVHGWPALKQFIKYIEVSPDTDYQGMFADVDGGRMQSACVYEIASMTNNYDGYLAQNIPERAPILAIDRENTMHLSRLLWRRGGSHMFNWWQGGSGSTLTPLVTSSTTLTNVVDNSSTAISASSPGYTLDMTLKNRESQSTIPIMFWAYGSVTGVNGGTVVLRNSAGVTYAAISNGWVAGAGASWVSVTAVIPAVADKYDLMYSCGTAGATFSLYAVSAYEHEV